MAPSQRSNANTRRLETQQNLDRSNVGPAVEGGVTEDLFTEPLLGNPLSIYIEKDVADRDELVELITRYGGIISQNYSGVSFILVDPHKDSGQSLYRQFIGKKQKVVLDARWARECIRLGSLQTYSTNWAGCKVTGNEQVIAAPPMPLSTPAVPNAAQALRPQDANRRATRQPIRNQAPQEFPNGMPAPAPLQPPHPPMATAAAAAQLPHNFSYQMYGQHPVVTQARPAMQTPTSAPPQTWQAANGIAPHQTHIVHQPQPQQPPPQQVIPQARPQQPSYEREEQWNSQFNAMAPQEPPPMNNTHAPSGYYDPRYRDDQQGWVNSHEYYGHPQYDATYQQQPPPPPQQQQQQPQPQQQPQQPQPQQPQQPQPQPQQQQQQPPPHEPYLPVASTSAPPEETVSTEKRGRKRTRSQATPAQPASALVLNRRHPPARSPTPPTRIIKSTYGGNLFTAEDVFYLKKYIDYCQAQGLVLSLREICERIAVKAPHHTFYSWRRYCNKHQIRLGGYAMDVDSRSPTPGHEGDEERRGRSHMPVQGIGTVVAAQRALQEEGPRNHSPTPPRALYRSTTGKGVAFTDEDVTFLVKMLAYRKAQGRLDMVAFWKEIATKAAHHSRASWMKYYRRHKHELNRTEADAPLPAPPAKKMRYGKKDDVLLAQYFVHKPEGTSDKIFQAFARLHPHHPWKGWQEHHRIHKAKIDHLILRLANGESIEVPDEDD